MGGSTIVLVESALQDLMWHYTRVRCPPEIISHTRQRLQRLISDISIADAVKAKEAEETTTDFCSGIVFDIVDDLLHNKVPFLEVESLQKELERVSFANEVLKLRLEENEEVDHLRQLTLNRKDDCLLYTVHKYFEEVFLLRKERAKLTSLLREAQRKIKKMEVTINNSNNNNNNNNNYNNSVSSMKRPGSGGGGGGGGGRSPPSASPYADFLFSTTMTQSYNSNNNNNNQNQHQKNNQHQHSRTNSMSLQASRTQHPLQQNTFDSLAGGTFASIINLERTAATFNNNNTEEAVSQSGVFNNNSNNNNNSMKENTTTMAIFSYDELAARMMIMDPDLAQLKTQNVKLIKEMDEMRKLFNQQKREMILKYETKIKQMDAKLKFLLAEDDEFEEARRTNKAKIHFRQLRPLRACIKSVSEGFERSKAAIREALADFGDDLLTVKNIVHSCMDQVVVNEDMCTAQISYAAEYVSTMVSNVGREEDNLDEEEDKKKQKYGSGGSAENVDAQRKEGETDKSEPKTTDKENNNSNTNDPSPENLDIIGTSQKRNAKSDITGNPVKTARHHFEACLEVGPFDDATTAKAKRYLKQHDISAFIRSFITSVTQNVDQYNDLLKRLALLSNYATKERSAIRMFEMSDYHDQILKKRRAELKSANNNNNDKKKQQNQTEQEQKDDNNNNNNNNANPTLIALSAASRVVADRRLYLRLFDIAKSDPRMADHEYYGLDQRMTKSEDEIIEENNEDDDGDDGKKGENDDNEENQSSKVTRENTLENAGEVNRSEQSLEKDSSAVVSVLPLFSEYITQISLGSYKQCIRDIIKLRFKRIADRCVRARMLENYDSFRYMVDLAKSKSNFDNGGDDDNDNNHHLAGDKESHFFPSTGCFLTLEKYDRWKKYLERIGKYQDEDAGKKIVALQERIKRIVTECVSKLPSSLLVKIVMEQTFNPQLVSSASDTASNSASGSEHHHHSHHNEIVESSWYSPFNDFDFSHAPEGEDWSINYNNNNISNSSKIKGKGKNGSNDGATVVHPLLSRNPQLSKYPHLRIVCPKCGKRLIVALPSNTNSIGFGKAGYHFSRMNKLAADSGLFGRKNSTSTPSTATGDPDTENNNTNKTTTNSTKNIGNEDDDEQRRSSKLFMNNNNINNNGRRLSSSASSQQKRVFFSPTVQEVLPESMIPAHLAAPATRHGYFAPTHSHFVSTMLLNTNTNANNNNNAGGSGRRGSASINVGEDGFVDDGSNLFATSFSSGSGEVSNKNNINRLSISGIGSGGGFVHPHYLDNDSLVNSILKSPLPKSILRGSSASSTSWNENNKRNDIDRSSGRSLQFIQDQIIRQHHQRQQYEPWQDSTSSHHASSPSTARTTTTATTINVRASSTSLMSDPSMIELDNADDEERLMLITRLKTKFGSDVEELLSTQQCLLPTVGGTVSIEMAQQSLKLSAQGAAKQFVRRRYQEQLLVSQMVAMQTYLKRMKERDFRSEQDLAALEKELAIAKEYNFHSGRPASAASNTTTSVNGTTTAAVIGVEDGKKQQQKQQSSSFIMSPSPPRPLLVLKTTMDSLNNLGFGHEDVRKRF